MERWRGFLERHGLDEIQDQPTLSGIATPTFHPETGQHRLFDTNQLPIFWADPGLLPRPSMQCDIQGRESQDIGGVLNGG
jgi:hypothetical protein